MSWPPEATTSSLRAVGAAARELDDDVGAGAGFEADLAGEVPDGGGRAGEDVAFLSETARRGEAAATRIAAASGANLWMGIGIGLRSVTLREGGCGSSGSLSGVGEWDSLGRPRV